MVMEGTRFTDPTSRHGPEQAWNRRPSPFVGSAVLFRGCGAPAVREWVAQCRRADTGEAEFCPRVLGPIVLVGRWGQQGRDYVVHVLVL
jgi:hypothetical protein